MSICHFGRWGLEGFWLAEGSCCPQSQAVQMCSVRGLWLRWKEGFSFRLTWLHCFMPVLITQSCVHLVCWGQRGIHPQEGIGGNIGSLLPNTFKSLGQVFHLLAHPVEVTPLGFCCQTIPGRDLKHSPSEAKMKCSWYFQSKPDYLLMFLEVIFSQVLTKSLETRSVQRCWKCH